MVVDPLPPDAASQVSPHALQSYARDLGWQPVPNKRPEIAVFHRPDSRLHQVIIPMDESLGDYAEAVSDAVQKLAEYENRAARDVLDFLLLPTADVLRFREVSPDADSGHLPFDHAVRVMTGTKRLLLSAAHSVLIPQPYHPRLSRSEAEEFVGRCRLGQTQRGSFVLTVACPLEVPVALPGLSSEPFTRQVTTLLIRVLESLSLASDASKADGLSDLRQNSGISANLCEALLLMRPTGDRATLTISSTWSRSVPSPRNEFSSAVLLRQRAFDVAEALAPRLRTGPLAPKPAWLVGYVDVLRGQATRGETRASGEVDFTIFDDEEGEISARGVLSADDYEVAAKAHLKSQFVAFKGLLRRLPRISRIDSIADFELLEFSDDIPDPMPTPESHQLNSGSQPPANEPGDIPF